MTDTGFIGIDLGTTMSAIAYLDSRGVTTVLPNSDGEPLTPSAIYLDGNHAVVGKSAKQSVSHLPEKVATFVKREMGKSTYSRLVDGRQFRPETLSAIILRKLKQDAERKVGPITRIVITVPAFFDDARRKATEDAGRIAGFDSVAIINEPTAAALAYCLEGHIGKGKSALPEFPGGNLTALVYDLGGGTFDVTVIRMQAKHVHILATDGEVKLGGKDWDDRIVDHVAKAFQTQYGVTIPPDRRHALLNQAETTKKLLSQIPVAEIEHSYQDRTIRLTLQRTEFEALTRDLLSRTEVVTKLVLKQAGLPGCETEPNWNAVDRILLVGGSTKMPMVPAMLKRVTGKQPDNSLDPDQVVAKGASIYGAVMATQDEQAGVLLSADVQNDVTNVGITDVNSHSLGIMTLDASEKPTYKVLIKKNQPVPCAGSIVCRTPTATSVVKVPVLEGEAPNPDANIRLGECVVHVPGGLPARSPFHVRLNFAKNGRVGVIALDMTSGRYVEVQIERQSGLSEEEILQEREFVAKLNIV